MKKTIKLLFAALALASFSACNDDNNEPAPENPVAEVKLESTVPAEGATVIASEVERIEINFTGNVTLNQNVQATLNGRNVRLAANGKTVSLDVDLAAGTQYSLVIPERMIIANKGLTYLPGMTLSFTTSESATPGSHNFAPITNASATAQATNVYNFICETSGKKIISGAMANVDNNNDFADWIYSVSGKYPALTGYDFIHLADSKKGAWIDYSNIAPARSQWEANGLVSYMWHWNVPDSEEAWRNNDTSKFGFNISGDNSTSFDIREALKEGTWQNQCILADIDKVAGYLKALQEAGIPVLWRPLHEAAGNYAGGGAWFWWGRYGDQYVTELWKLMHDRLVNHHGLNNLIWVWTAQYQAGQADKMKASYPGDEYVDIVGLDLYEDNDNSQVEAYAAGLDLASGRKPVSLSECGRVPSPDKCLSEGADWTWFMIWYTYDIKGSSATTDGFGNTAESLRAVMGNSRVITRDQMPSLK